MRAAEEAVLGASILDEECARKVIDELDEGMFTCPDTKAIFRVMADMYWQGKPVDSVTILKEIPEHKVLIVSLAQSLPSFRNINEYIYLVKSEALDKMLRKSLSDIAVSGKSVEDKLGNLQTLTKDYERLMRSGLNATDFKTAAKRFAEWLKSRQDDHIKTGFYSLNKITGGIIKSGVFVIAARPGGGKTDLAVNLAAKIAKSQKVLYFSMEMPTEQLMERIVSNALNIDAAALRDKTINDDEMKSVEAFTESMGKIFLEFIDEPRISVNTVRRYIEVHKPDIVFIDHIGLMERPNIREQYKALGLVSNNLKQLALEKKIAIVELVQMSRRIESSSSREPSLSDLRESGDIEQDADYVAFLVPQEDDGRQLSGGAYRRADLFLKKNRYGGTGKLEFTWQPQYHRYTEVEKRY